MGRTRSEARARYFIRREIKQRGWNASHVDRGGDLLEENEIGAYFPDIGLGLSKPDFMLCLRGNPSIVIEAKNEVGKLDTAVDQAINYADTINAHGAYTVKIVVGVAGQDDTGHRVEVYFLSGRRWRPLMAYGAALTNIPTVSETHRALASGDGNTQVEIPGPEEFVGAAIEMSRVFRACKVEAPLRPRVLGALVLAMAHGNVSACPQNVLESINTLVAHAIDEDPELAGPTKDLLKSSLTLSEADFGRMAPQFERAANTLRRLNVRAVMETGTDFLGIFYEAFLRYGYDNKALGIVFTPRHITQFCIDLTGVSPSDRVVDIACGTGGFLVSAFDKMMKQAGDNPKSMNKIKRSLCGFETNPTVWALAMLNMIFRGDGKSHIGCSSCFDADNRKRVNEQFTRAYLNPPFSQQGEPERDFIDAALDALEPGGILAAVVKAGVFVDSEHKAWRKGLVGRHTPLAVVGLPDDLFYPAAAPTSILMVQAHRPLKSTDRVLFARVWNDGFEKLKGKRVARSGSQLPQIIEAVHTVRAGLEANSPLITIVEGEELMGGQELGPQEWLPQPAIPVEDESGRQKVVLESVVRSVIWIPGLGDSVLTDFGAAWTSAPNLPCGVNASLFQFFNVSLGKSIGEKHYSEGTLPYISSGESINSIVRLVHADASEVFPVGGITVTAFGHASLQPWPFAARGNGGSAVRVLTPKYSMSVRELIWFVAQINSHQWRFPYSRMATMARLKRLVVTSPAHRMEDGALDIANRVRQMESAFKEASKPVKVLNKEIE